MDLAKIFSSQNDNLDIIHNHNLDNEVYQEEIQQNEALILSKFKAIGKNHESTITKQELLSFLDSNLGDGKQFDRNVADKILSVLEGSNETILVSDFTKTYIQVLEELKLNIQEFQVNYQQEKQNNEAYKRSSLEYKNELLNNDGINEAVAKFIISKISLEFTNPQLLPQVSIKISYRDQVSQTHHKNSGYVWDETIDLAIKDKRVVMFEVLSGTNTIGEINFNLNAIDTQEEYEALLEVNEKNSKAIVAKINCRIQFIWSHFKYYTDLATKCEKKIAKYDETILKSNKILETLNGPFNFVSSSNKEPVFDIGLAKILKKNIPQDKQDIIVNAVEDVIKDKLHQENIAWLQLIRYMLIGVMTLAFLSCFEQANFIDILLPGYMLLITYTTISNNYTGYLNQFFSFTCCLLAYDLFWLIFASTTGSSYDGGVENFLKGLVFLLKFLSIFLKILLAGGLFIHLTRAEKEPNKDLYLMSTGVTQINN